MKNSRLEDLFKVLLQVVSTVEVHCSQHHVFGVIVQFITLIRFEFFKPRLVFVRKVIVYNTLIDFISDTLRLFTKKKHGFDF